MVARTDAELSALSDDFRTFMRNLDVDDKAYATEVLKEALGLKNVRNVQLWYSDTTTYRRICNRKVGTEELESRIAVVESLLNRRQINSPQKQRTSARDPVSDGRVLGRYLADDYTRTALNTLSLTDNDGMTLEYDSDSGSDEGVVTDEDTDEFKDVVS